jgi:hypothetical protein
MTPIDRPYLTEKYKIKINGKSGRMVPIVKKSAINN